MDIELDVLLVNIRKSGSLNSSAHLDRTIHRETTTGRALLEHGTHLGELAVSRHGAVIAVDADFCVDVLDPAAWGEVTRLC